MKLVYHHYKDFAKEAEDVRQGWWTCPPELICTKQEEKKLRKWWHFFNGKDAYIEDPLGCTQCNYVMYKRIPKLFRKIFLRIQKKEHVYDVQ